MLEKLAQFAFAYPVRFKGPRQRSWRYEYLAGDRAFMLRYADASETQIGFRVTRRYKEFLSTYEIIAVDNDLYWPIVESDHSVDSDQAWSNIDPDRHVTVVDFLDGIKQGNRDYLRVLHGVQLPSAYGLRKSITELNARIDPSDRREELLVKAQRGGSQLLAYDGFMYLRGGEPVYVCQGRGWNHLLSKASLDGIKVVDSRSRWQNTHYGVRSRGSYDRYALDPRAKAGEIFLADELTMAKSLVADNYLAIRQDDDTIEIVNCKNIRTNPLDLHVEASIYALNFHIRKEISGENPLFEGSAAIRRLASQEGLGWRVGAAAIVEFINSCERNKRGTENYDLYRYAVLELERLDKHCAQRGVAPISRLDDEDDDAIAALAI